MSDGGWDLVQDGELNPSYKSLNPARDEIRILRLKPRQYNRENGKDDQEIVCLLEQSSLGDAVVYTALSYAWESGLNSQPVLVSGRECWVSGNLAGALLHLRHETEDVILWVDQICINQEDYTEKASQIQIMKPIYERAARVVAWLGTSTDESDLALITLRCIGKYHNSSWNGKIFEEIVEELQQNEALGSGDWLSRHDLLGKLTYALFAFTARTYWTRLWVLQEFVVATELLIMCGTQAITAECLHDAWAYLNGQNKTIARYRSSAALDIATIARDWQRNPGSWNAWLLITHFNSQRARYHAHYQHETTDHGFVRDLFGIIYMTLTTFSGHISMNCTDPRDKIFSLLGLASDSHTFRQFPDYTRSTEGIYEELARVLIQRGHVDMLSFCQEDPNLRQRRMASWAADWSLKIRIPLWGKLPINASTDGPIDLRVSIPDDKSLALSGTCVGTIQSHGSCWNHQGPLNQDEMQTFLQQLRHFCAQSDLIPVDGEEFVCAQLAAPGALPYYSGNKQMMLTEYKALGERLERGLYPPGRSRAELGSEDVCVYEEQLRGQLFSCPFITDNDHVGIAPPYIQEGDIIAIFPGGHIPYVLRQVRDDKFTLVGGAFIHGIMNGEYYSKRHPSRSYVIV